VISWQVPQWAALILSLALLSIFYSMPARAQGVDEPAALLARSNELYFQGKYGDAIPLADRYVAIVRQKYGEDPIE
jgi:hypothetical protein